MPLPLLRPYGQRGPKADKPGGRCEGCGLGGQTQSLRCGILAAKADRQAISDVVIIPLRILRALVALFVGTKSVVARLVGASIPRNFFLEHYADAFVKTHGR